MFTKFYNKMPFEIKFRKVWESGTPPVILKSGEIIEGPYDSLIQYAFLAPIPIDFSNVSSSIQNNNMEYTDNLILDVPNETKLQIYNEKENKLEEEKIEQPIEIDTSIEIGFDPKTVNWLTVKVDQLETACKKLNINIDSLSDKKPKEKKWELVRIIKRYYKI